jgi:hypothetical protein
MIGTEGIVELHANLDRLWTWPEELLPGCLRAIDGVETLVSARGDNLVDTGSPDMHRIALEGVAIKVLYLTGYSRPIAAVLGRPQLSFIRERPG